MISSPVLAVHTLRLLYISDACTLDVFTILARSYFVLPCISGAAYNGLAEILWPSLGLGLYYLLLDMIECDDQ